MHPFASPCALHPAPGWGQGEMTWNPLGTRDDFWGAQALYSQRGVQSRGVSSPSLMGRWSSRSVGNSRGCWRRDQWYHPWRVNRQRSARANPSIHPACCYFCSSAVVMPCSVLKAKLLPFKLCQNLSWDFVKITEEWNAAVLYRTKEKFHLHTVILGALSMAAAHVYTAIPNVDVINRPSLLLIKRSRLVPAETSCLRPLEEKEKKKGSALPKLIFILTEGKFQPCSWTAPGRFIQYQHSPGLIPDSNKVPERPRRELPNSESSPGKPAAGRQGWAQLLLWSRCSPRTCWYQLRLVQVSRLYKSQINLTSMLMKGEVASRIL